MTELLKTADTVPSVDDVKQQHPHRSELEHVLDNLGYFLADVEGYKAVFSGVGHTVCPLCYQSVLVV